MSTNDFPIANQSDDEPMRELLMRIEQKLDDLIGDSAAREFYSTADIATILGRAEFTVREWCRQGRINARKKLCGRGKTGEWMIAHEELIRIQAEGLLPPNSLRWQNGGTTVG